tara:strand:+ start:2306 stop:2587 length:282 start_codon:yes stop_codon:yes gene_type:complete
MAWKEFEKRKQYDDARYGDEYNKLKRLQTLSRLGYIPTKKTIDKYEISLDDLNKHFNKYLGKAEENDDLVKRKERFQTLLATFQSHSASNNVL